MDKFDTLNTIWNALHGYREDCIPGDEEHDEYAEQWEAITEAMADVSDAIDRAEYADTACCMIEALCDDKALKERYMRAIEGGADCLREWCLANAKLCSDAYDQLSDEERDQWSNSDGYDFGFVPDWLSNYIHVLENKLTGRLGVAKIQVSIDPQRGFVIRNDAGAILAKRDALDCTGQEWYALWSTIDRLAERHDLS